jgi:hypothetical protein
MTWPVADILKQAQREGWPTSSVDAMANHHLCGNLLTRDYVNNCFAGHAATREDGPGEARQGAAPRLRTPGVASASSTEGNTVATPTPEELRQLQDAIDHKARSGEDTGVLNRILEIGAEQAARPDTP